MAIKLRYYQQDAINAVMQYFYDGNRGNPIVAMPTGTGKSVVIGGFVKLIFDNWPGQRIMMMTHVKELISQNAEALRSVWPLAPIGIYSAGLNSRDMIQPIVYGGVASIANAIKKGEELEQHKPAQYRNFGWRDLVLIDECHLISPEDNTQYRYVLRKLKEANPHIKVIGFSATPYRLKLGHLTDDGGIFTDVCYDLTSLENFNRLLDEGYLAPLINKRMLNPTNTDGIKITGGEFNSHEMQERFDKYELMLAQVQEIVTYGQDRNSWLIFTSGISACEHATEMFRAHGVEVDYAHSKRPGNANDQAIVKFKAGETRCLVNACKLTTGFDHPPIDLIGVMVATTSPGKWVQMLGRGTRTSRESGKVDTLVCDFGNNITRLGPINDPVLPRKPGKPGRDAPIKICEECGTYHHAAVRYCCVCGFEFLFKPQSNQTEQSCEGELIRKSKPEKEEIYKWYNVSTVTYSKHIKPGNPSSLKVTYYCEGLTISEWVCFEHKGGIRKKAESWFMQRSQHNVMPSTIDESLLLAPGLAKPTQIRVWMSTRYPEILDFVF